MNCSTLNECMTNPDLHSTDQVLLGLAKYYSNTTQPLGFQQLFHNFLFNVLGGVTLIHVVYSIKVSFLVRLPLIDPLFALTLFE
jgi:hypothetical protein